MNIRVIGKNINPTESINAKIESKMEKLQQYLNVDTDVKVTISAEKEKQTVEVTVLPIKGPIIRAEEGQKDLYSAIDGVYDKLYNHRALHVRSRRQRQMCIRDRFNCSFNFPKGVYKSSIYRANRDDSLLLLKCKNINNINSKSFKH